MKKEPISYTDFAKLDLRVGTVTSAAPIEASEKLMSLQVSLGEDYGTVEILAGIAPFYEAEAIVGKQLIFLANLQPKPMAGHISNGMMIAIDSDARPILIEVNEKLADGLRLC